MGKSTIPHLNRAIIMDMANCSMKAVVQSALPSAFRSTMDLCMFNTQYKSREQQFGCMESVDVMLQQLSLGFGFLGRKCCDCC